MKKLKLYIILLIGVLSLTACLVDGSWLGLVGRWQDTEYSEVQIEFTESGQFSEYLLGERKQYGNFVADGNTITINYLSPCGDFCSVKLKFSVTEETLILTDSDRDYVYKKFIP